MAGNPQLDRLQDMASDKGETWDLSPKDQEAISWILTDYDRLKAELAEARKDTARLDYCEGKDGRLDRILSCYFNSPEDTTYRDAIDTVADEEATWLT